MFTWQTLIEQLPPPNLQSLAATVRDTFGIQGRPITLTQFLSADISQTDVMSGDANGLITLWAKLLTPENRAEAEDYKQYVALFEQPEQPLAAAFAAALEQAGIGYDEFRNGSADDKMEELLKAGYPIYWAATLQALQVRGQRMMDDQGRVTALLEATSATWQPAMKQLLSQLRAQKPYVSLTTIAQAPLNRLTQDLSLLNEGAAYFSVILQQLIDLAKQIVAENYTPEVELEKFLGSAPIERTAAQALLQRLADKPTAAIATLATTSVESLLPQFSGMVPANSPIAYAVAQLFQNQISQFLKAESTFGNGDVAVQPELRQLDGLLTGVEKKPLANLGLRLSQVFSSGSQVVIGELFTSPDGHFPIRLRQEYALDAADGISPIPAVLLIEVFAKGKPFAAEPDAQATYELPGDQQKVTVATGLSNDLPLLESRAVADVLPEALPNELQEYLTSHDITSLADIRRIGGLLNRSDVPLEDEAAQVAARQLEGLARFEVISSDTALATELLQAGFYSPQQLLAETTREDLVQQLASPDDLRWQESDLLDDRRRQVAAFYEQTAAVEALTQTVGLFAAAEKNAGWGTEPVLLFPPDSDQEQEVAGIETHDDTSSYQRIIVPQESYNPAPNGMTTAYQAAQQCDCTACRSAVGPTAYLAALLQYAQTNLRNTDQPLAAVSPQFLQNALLQPFNDMTLSCQYAEEQVCKYRLAIEVIQAYWRNRTVPQPGRALTFAEGQPYVKAILEALLQDLGTSTQEIQAATSDTARAALEDRLRLPEAAVAALQQRFGASVLGSHRSLDTIEDDLEQIFGVASTARDPLSTGSKLVESSPTSSAVQLVRWNFQGVQWDLNTGRDGLLHLEVLVDSAATNPKHRITVYKNSKSEDTVVARGNFVARPAVGGVRQFAASLYSQHGSELRGSVVIAVSSGIGAPPLVDTRFAVSAVPAITAWRLQFLNDEWLKQDAEAVLPLQSNTGTSWNGQPYLIDPDLLGPDDFRPVGSRLNPADNIAYQIWRNRYDSIENQRFQTTQAQDYFGALLNDLTGGPFHNIKFSYSTIAPVVLTEKKAWSTVQDGYRQLEGSALLDRVQTDFQSADATKIAAAAQVLHDLGLDRDGFDRLYALWKKSLALNGLLEATEEFEFYDILRQTLKKTFATEWAREERVHAIQLNGQWFQSAIHEPQEGTWVKAVADEFGISSQYIPRIDPDETTPLDLPDPGTFGKEAADFWRYRKAELQAKQLAIAAIAIAPGTANQRANAMLEYAYRVNPVAPNATPATPPYSLLERSWAAYQDDQDAKHKAASTYFLETLALRPKEAEQLMALRSQVVSNATDASWLEMARILTLGWKRAVAYHQLYTVEGYPTDGLDAWSQRERDEMGTDFIQVLVMTRKQRLVKWRASAAKRANWTAALRQAFKRPLIDPDQLVANDFRQAGERSRNVDTSSTPIPASTVRPYLNPAFDLFSQRAALLTTWYASLQGSLPAATSSTATQVAAYKSLLATELGAPWETIKELHRQLRQNVDVAADLLRLNLTSAGLNLLVSQTEAPDAAQVTAFLHLLVQVRKTRRYADWQREETTLRLNPVPHYFREPQSEAVPLPSLPWRNSLVERRALQKTLAARYAQTQATAEVQAQAVKSAEDQYLPLLRDVLLDFKVVQGNSRETKADKLSTKYLLDFKIACCQHTTRVAQGIDVLQKLYFNLRSSLTSAIPGLALNSGADSRFDADWQWLGSYERWRSLMFLYLYPENVLLPALKPQQTSPFKELVSNTRQMAQLTPARATALFKAYERDFVDLTNLNLAATVQTYAAASNSISRELTVFQIAHAPLGKRAFWSTYYTRSGAGMDPSFNWQPLPGNTQVDKIVGACVFQNSSAERYLCVFAFIKNEQFNNTPTASLSKLAIHRLNLATWEWDETFTPLRFPNADTVEIDNVLLISHKDEARKPIIGGIRFRSNMTIDDLTKPPFRTISTPPNSLAGLGDIKLRQAELFHLRLGDDAQSVQEVASASVLGFNDFVLASAMVSSIDGTDAVHYLCFQKLGTDTANFTLTGFSTTVPETKVANATRKVVVELTIKNPASSTQPSFLASLPGAGSWFYNQFANLFTNGASGYWINPITGLYTASSIIGNPGNPPAGINIGTVRPQSVGTVLTDFAYSNGMPLVSFNDVLNSFDFYFNTTSSAGEITQKVRVAPGAYSPDTIVYTHNQPNSIEYASAFYLIAANATQPEHYSYIGPRHVSSVDLRELQLSLPFPTKQKSTVVNGETLQSFSVQAPSGGTPSITYLTTPQLPAVFPTVTADNLNLRRGRLKTLLTAVNIPVFTSLAWEAYYFTPLFLAMELYRAKYYEEALRYSRLFYDYTQTTLAKRTTFPGLDDTNTAQFDTVMAWLADASNPHTLAGLRPDSHLRFAVASVVRCLVGYGDSEFSRDTTESVSRARGLYELALGLLKQDVLLYDVQDCYVILNQLDSIVIPTWWAQWQVMKDLLAQVNQRQVILDILQDQSVNGTPRPGIIQLFTLARQNGNWSEQFNAAWQLINADLAALIGKYETLGNFQAGAGGVALPSSAARVGLLNQATFEAVSKALSTQVQQQFNAVAKQVKEQAGEADYSWLAQKTGPVIDPDSGGLGNYTPAVYLQLALNTTRPFVPFVSADFCVPTNPVPYALQLQAELNLYKIRTCRNIAGIQRELDPYAAPTDTTSGLPAIGANGQLTRAGRLVVPTTQYRYAYIMERARQLVSLAQQAEASLLSALEKRDSEAYNLLKARQDISVSKATIQLQNLRSQEAEDSIDLAELNLQKSELAESQYNEWLNEGLNSYEKDMLIAIQLASEASAYQSKTQGAASALSAIASAGATGGLVAIASGVLSKLAGDFGAAAAYQNGRNQTLQILATAERRNNDWIFQRNLAAKDIQIGQQQIHLADDRLRIVGQEKRISELQLDNAEAVLNFLTTKFTNAELYDWMSQILESAYSYFLQQATATARTAELQLAFERQEAPVGLVQEDYWTPPTDSSTAVVETTSPTAVDRKGLTGSVRLLQDLTRLDQYAFETNRRKLQLTKTVSLAQSFPTEFVRFRETGVLPFALPQAVFDQDFPGHYLRIIRRVRTSVIALVPPTEGIKARLSTAGNSRVVVSGTPFQTLMLPRPAESVSLTSPINATGLFELEQQPGEMLYPFEGTGVDVPWTFSLQPAANISLDFTSIADVLITLDYTALESYDYGQQVVKGMNPERQQMVALSFRNRFADQWYDLHHADELEQQDQYKARFTIEAADLPLNLRNTSLRSISIYLDAPTDDDFTDRSGLDLAFGRTGSQGSTGVARTNTYGLVSTRTGTGNGPIYTGNAGVLTALLGTSPAGDWVLDMGRSSALRARLDAGKVNDIYLIMEVEGDAPTYIL